MVQVLGSLQEYQQAVATQGRLVVVDFFATWCPPCKMIAPKFEQMSAENPHVSFFKVDVDANPQASQAGGIKAMPTFIFFKNGQEITRIQGANEAAIRQNIAQYGGQAGNNTQAQSQGGVGQGMVPHTQPCKSTGGSTSIFVSFQNHSGSAVSFDWLDYNGQRVNYGTLQPGQSVNQQTFVTHPWRFYTAQGHELGIWPNNQNVAPNSQFNLVISADLVASVSGGNAPAPQPNVNMGG